jgi:uncharacterized protein (TIGR03083 family)
LDEHAKWELIATQRHVLADLLAELDDADWERPSLCRQWRIRDVAAHVALTPQSPGVLRILGHGLRARGNFDAVNRDMAVAHASRPQADLVAELRRLADSRRKPVITTLDNLVFDVLVHVQDVALPLQRTVTMPADGARAGLERVWRMGWPFWARRRCAGTRLVATDLDWTASAGSADREIRGPAASLLLLLTGRTAAAAPNLTGSGIGHVS